MNTRLLCLLVLSSVVAFGANDQDAESANETTQAESVVSLVKQLGDEDFKKRESAEQKLLRLVENNPKLIDLLNSSLKDSVRLEAKIRLNRVINTVAAKTPLQTIEFNETTFNNQTWKLFQPTKSSYSFKDGVLEVDSMDQIKDSLLFIHRFKKATGDARLVFDAEIKILKERHRTGAGGIHLNVEDHLSGNALMIQAGGVFAYRHNVVHKMDATDGWHHYRIVAAGATQQIFVDDMDKPIFELPRHKANGRQWATFGDGTGAAAAHAQIRNVSLSVYPSSK